MRKLVHWLSVTLTVLSLSQVTVQGQNTLDRDSWNVDAGDWGNDDNWVDDLGDPSQTPTLDDDRWALVDRGVATVSGSHQTSGLTIGGGTVEIGAGASLEIALQDNAFSFGQTQINNRGTLRLLDDGSYQGLNGSIAGTVELSQPGTLAFTGDASLQGTFRFDVTGDGNAALVAGGEATVGGSIVPNFIGTNPAFGDTITFVEADTVKLNSPTLELPGALPRGLQARIVADGGNASITFANLPILQVDRATADAKILNIIGGPIEMTGYVVESGLATLEPNGFSGFGGNLWDRPNPLATTMAEFSLTETMTVAVDQSLDIGKIYNGGATLPEDEDVTFKYFTPDGEIVDALVEYVGPANDLVLNANPQTGEVTIQHLSAFVDPIEVTGYSVVSPSGSLNVEGWTSLENAGVTGWLGTDPRADLISELNLSDSTLFENGTVVSLGNIFDIENGVRDLVLQYTTTTELLRATVEYQLTGGPPPVGIPGDIDGDLDVDFDDFVLLANAFGSTVDPPGTGADIVANGIVDFDDFVTLSNNFGQSVAAASVPEPNSLSIFGLGSLLMLAGRRRRKATRRIIAMGKTLSGQTKRQNGKTSWVSIVCGFLVLMGATSQTDAIENFTVSNWGEGSQIWWEAEDFDERIPDTEDHFALSLAPDGEEAFGDDELNTINRIGAGGRISYTFSLDQIGQGGTWYFWGRVLNPSNQSDFMLVEGHAGDIIPTEEPFSGTFDNEQRIFERNTGPPFGWSGGGEGHVKTLQDGENTMHIVHRQGNNTVFWDVMMWTDDPNYVPNDTDYFDSEPLILIDNPGDFNGDGMVDLADYAILLANYNADVERGVDGDITFNGHVDYRDFVDFRATFEAQAAGAAAVPEPASVYLLGFGALLLGRLRRRRPGATRHPLRPPNAVAGIGILPLLLAAIFVHASTQQSAAQENVVIQEEGAEFLAFEAEDFFDLNNADDESGWGRVDVGSFVTTPPASPGSVVLDDETTAARRAAIFDFPGGSEQDFVRYRLQFVEEGDYSLYLRYTMYDIQGDATYGNEDSVYISSEFGFDGELIDTDADPRGPRDGPPSYYSGGFPKGVQRQEGNFDWWNAQAAGDDDTTINTDGVYFPDLNVELDFGIAARERGVAIDRIVFHIDPDLTPEELDAIPSWDPFTIGVLPGDFNDDGAVNFDDFSILRANFGSMFDFAESYGRGDGTRDGRVDLADFIQFRQIFNAPAAAQVASVPEPSTLSVLFGGFLLAIAARRRRRKTLPRTHLMC